MSALGAVADYLPHRPPMLLVDRIEDVTADRIVCSTRIEAGWVFLQDGVVHASVMLEVIAQACAIHAGVMASRRGGDSGTGPGMLVSCREAALHVETFQLGDELTITATRVPGAPPLTTFDGEVHRRGELCVRLQLSVMQGGVA